MNASESTVLLIGTAPGQARLVRETLASATGGPFEVSHASRLADGLPLLVHGGFDAVFLDLPLPDATVAEALGHVARAVPAAAIVALVAPCRVGQDQTAVPRGAHATLVKEPMWELDAPRLTRALQVAHHARAHGLAVAPRLARRRRAVMSFIGAGGGSGTSTTALQAAHELSAQGARTVVAEMRTWPGGLSALTGVCGRGHLGLLLDRPPGQISADDLDRALTSVLPRLKLLLAPPEDRDLAPLTADQASALLDLLTRIADCVVVDLPCEVSPAMQTVCAASSLIAVVTRDEPADVWKARHIVQLLGSWAPAAGRVGAVVVQHRAGSLPDEGALRRELGCEILAVVPALFALPALSVRTPCFREVFERFEARVGTPAENRTIRE